MALNERDLSAQLLRRQTILAQFGEMALRSNDLDKILTEACRLVGEALGTDLAKVVELQPDGKTLLVRAGVGWKDGVVGVETISLDDDTSEAYALKTGEPMVSPDIAKETRFTYAPFLSDNGAQAVANVIIIGGKDRSPFGILQIDSRVPREFDDVDITFLRGYANLLAAAVDRLRVLDEMRDDATRLRLALEAGQLGSFELDLKTGTASGPQRLAKVLGADAPALAGALLDLIHPEDRERVASVWRDAIASHGDLHVEFRASSHEDKDTRWVEMHARPDGDSTPDRLVGVVQDITQRKLAEKLLRDTNATLEEQVSERTISLGESNAQLDAFAYTVSHDLRAPLRAMEGFARILLDDFSSGIGPDGERYATRIVAAAKRMERLIDDLLAFSRVQRADVALQAVDPGRAVRRTIAEVKSAALDPNAVSIEVTTPLPLVRADRSILAQVLNNLITNAVKFGQPGHALHVSVSAERRGDRIRISVEDDGIGIATEHQQRIFNVFERLHGQETYPGTGVGLAIVKAGVERMDGTFGVVSDLNQGSRFWIELVAADVAAA